MTEQPRCKAGRGVRQPVANCLRPRAHHRSVGPAPLFGGCAEYVERLPGVADRGLTYSLSDLFSISANGLSFVAVGVVFGAGAFGYMVGRRAGKRDERRHWERRITGDAREVDCTLTMEMASRYRLRTCPDGSRDPGEAVAALYQASD
jgi:hypothetical protein